MKEVVVVRPDWSDTACKWGSEQLKRKTIAYAQDKGWSVTDLYADDAVKAKIIQALSRVTYGSLLGHGNNNVYTGQRQAIVFQVGDQATLDFCKASTGRGINFLSCLIGKELLPWMTLNGLKFAKGYTEEFVFALDQANFPNSAAEPFFLSYCEYDRAYVSTEDELKAFDAELRMWEKVIDESDPTTKRYKVQDYNACNLFKEGKAVPRPAPKPWCDYSAAIVVAGCFLGKLIGLPNFGWSVLSALRQVRWALFKIPPGNP